MYFLLKNTILYVEQIKKELDQCFGKLLTRRVGITFKESSTVYCGNYENQHENAAAEGIKPIFEQQWKVLRVYGNMTTVIILFVTKLKFLHLKNYKKHVGRFFCQTLASLRSQ